MNRKKGIPSKTSCGDCATAQSSSCSAGACPPLLCRSKKLAGNITPKPFPGYSILSGALGVLLAALMLLCTSCIFETKKEKRIRTVDLIGPGKLPPIIPGPREMKISGMSLRLQRCAVLFGESYPTLPNLFVLKKLLEEKGVQVRFNPPDDYSSVSTLVLLGCPDRNTLALEYFKRLRIKIDRAKWDSLPPNAYYLYAGPDERGEKNVVILAGRTPLGDYFAIQTLAQLIILKDGVPYLREVQILDWIEF